MSDEIIQKVTKSSSSLIEVFLISVNQLQDKAAVLTQLRKQRGKRVPEGLASVEELREFRCSATHTVRAILFSLEIILLLDN